MPELHIQLLGDFRLEYADALVSQVNSPRLQALLTYLVIHRDAPQLRQHLAFQIWPGSSEAQARTNLRQLAHSLRQALPDADQFVHADAQTLQWRCDAPFRLDVVEFEEALARVDAAEQTDQHTLRVALEQAVTLYRGDLLPSCYDDWVLSERERLRQAYMLALERLVLLLERQGDPRVAIGYAQRLLRHDPLREETYRALMRLHAACGDRAGALRVYRTCATVLERELGVGPSAATREAYEQLMAVGAQAAPVTPPRPPNTNLPVPLTSFVGREAHMAEVIHLLQTTRLLTLTGPGGCGKTRLAVEAATNQLDQYPDGVWWVDLAALSDAALVPQVVATALGVREQPGRALPETLLDYLRAKQLLLLLDNCEHLVGSCAQWVEQWLGACPRLQILATSREALSTGGEITWSVPPLSLPESQPLANADKLMSYGAVQLFVERATTVLPTFRLNSANDSFVAQICRRLDGIPLAIELAAARVKVLTVEQVAARLDDVFNLLTAGRRTALLRHQTLRAAMDWSYDFLPDRERVLFQRLAVFAGGFTLAAAEAVCAGGGLEAGKVLDLLSHLVDKSLVAVTQDVATRYSLLETIRQYAYERLVESGEEGRVRDQHLSHFVRLAEEAEPKLHTAEEVPCMNQLEAELYNIRTALNWSMRGRKIEMGLRLAVALNIFWWTRGYQEGIENLRKLLAYSDSASPTSARAKALSVLGHLHAVTGDYRRGNIVAHEALATAQAVGDARTEAYTLYRLGFANIGLDNQVEAKARLEQALAVGRALGDERVEAFSLEGLGVLALLIGEYAQAQLWFAMVFILARELGDMNLWTMGVRHWGYALFHQLDYAGALAKFHESLALNVEMGDKRSVAACLAACAAVALADEQLVRAGHLLGVVEALLESLGVSLASYDQEQYMRSAATLRQRIDAAAFGALLAEGREMTQEEAIADALTLVTGVKGA